MAIQRAAWTGRESCPSHAWASRGCGWQWEDVVRGGFGSAYDRYRSDVNGSGAANPPYVLNPALNFGYLQDIGSGGGGALSPSAVFGVDQGADWPVVYSYSLGVQRDLFKDTRVLDVSYVGSQSRHNPRRRNETRCSMERPSMLGSGSDAVCQRRDTGRRAGSASGASGGGPWIQRAVRASSGFPAALRWI